MVQDKSDPIIWATSVLTQAGVENARFEAQLLLGLALHVPRSSVVGRTHPPLTEWQQARFAELVERRKARVPFAYLRGTQEFYGLEFGVTPDVLIPRPETELLVELALERAKELLQTQSTVLLADVGTGSGCIPVAILKYQGRARAIAVDLSAEALNIAAQNALRHQVADRLRLVQADLLTGASANRLDIIVSNPPYIPSEDVDALQPEVARYEPRLALDGGTDGLFPYRRLIQQAKNALKPGGRLWMEVGQGQAQDVSALLWQAGYSEVQSHRDLAGIERAVGGDAGD